MEMYISKLDCERFGYKIAKIDSWEHLDILGLVKQLRDAGVKLVIAKINSAQLPIINILEDLGFRIKDTQVTYKYDIKKLDFNISSLHSDFKIRTSMEHDVNEMISIARESFAEYGHYFADKRLDKKHCHEIYPDWARRSCLDKTVSDKIFVAVVEEKVVGFLSFKIHLKNAEKYAVGGMGAVAKACRKYGIFDKLVKHGISWGADIGLTWEEHNVLTNNYSVNRIFSRAGFVINNSFMTLHGWLE